MYDFEYYNFEWQALLFLLHINGNATINVMEFSYIITSLTQGAIILDPARVKLLYRIQALN